MANGNIWFWYKYNNQTPNGKWQHMVELLDHAVETLISKFTALAFKKPVSSIPALL